MAFIETTCPICNEKNELDSSKDSFYCVHCGKKSLTKAAIAYNQCRDLQSSDLNDAEPESEQTPAIVEDAAELLEDNVIPTSNAPAITKATAEAAVEEATETVAE